MKWKPQNIRTINTEDSDEKGVTYAETKQTWITTHRHVSEEDIIVTSIEESVHEALIRVGMNILVDGEQEEWFVEKMFWALNGWILVK